MKKLLTIGLLASSLAFGDEAPAMTTEPVKASAGYVSLGLGPCPIPLPVFGLGGRFQNGHHGFDISGQVTTVGSPLTAVKENLLYLYYFKPNLASQVYAGGGVSFTEVFSRGRVGVLAAPQFIVGKDYTNESGGRRYFQAQIDFPTANLKDMHRHGRHHSHGVSYFPIVVLSYGLCF